MFIDTSGWIVGAPLPSNFDVKARHPKYDEMLPYWERCRDARAGTKAIKTSKNAETYLPRLDSQVLYGEDKDNGKTPGRKNREYANYKDRAVWFGAVSRTVEAFVSMPFAKPVKYNSKSKTLPKDFEESDIIKYTSQDEESFPALMKACAEEILVVNRVGILEDYPVRVDDNGATSEMSLLDAEKNKIFSYSVMYKAEQIVNWGMATHNGRKVESFYVLEESWLDYSASLSSPKSKLRWRILLLEEKEGGALVYKQIVAKEGVDEKIIIDSMIEPKMNDKLFDYIPFWCLNVYGNKADEVKEPEILDLVDMNIGHYRNSADYENEMHYVSIKTAIFPGWNREEYGDPVLGGALATPPEQVPFILEATSVSGLAQEMKDKKELMAILGAQMLANKGRYQQSATTAEIDNQGQSGILSSLSATLEAFFGELLTLKYEWAGLGEEQLSVQLDREYMRNTVKPEMVKDLVAAVQAGKMSFKTFYYNVQKLDMYPNGWTEAQEMDAIDNAGLGANSQEMFTVMDSLNKRLAVLENKGAEEPAKGAVDDKTAQSGTKPVPDVKIKGVINEK